MEILFINNVLTEEKKLGILTSINNELSENIKISNCSL
jgi:hypothetical protein